MEKKIALYARVSTMQQADDGFGLDVQLKDLRALAEAGEHNYIEFVDRGISGTDIEKRFGLQSLLEEVKNKTIKEVWVTKLSRLGRNSRDVLNIIHTIVDYLKTLRELYVIEELPSWTPKLRSKATIRTKHIRHFTDPAIASALLNATPKNLIYDIKTFGLLFESLVIRDLRIYTQFLQGDIFHYRDSSNLEVDAIIKLQDGSWAVIEIKLGATQIDEAANNLITFVNKVDTRIKPSFLMVITGTPYGYLREDGVYVVPIGCLKP